MKIFKLNNIYQIQNNESEDSTCSQCCAVPKLCDEYSSSAGAKVCIQATSKADCTSKNLEDFDFEEDPDLICGFYKRPTYGGIVDGASSATCYFDKDGNGCYSLLTCRQLKKQGESYTECECKEECEERGGEFSQLPPGDPGSPCAGNFINGQCGNCEDKEEPPIDDPGGTIPPPPPPPPPGVPSPPSAQDPSPENPPTFPPYAPPFSPPSGVPGPPSPPPGGPAQECPIPKTLEVESTIGFDPNGGTLDIYDSNNNWITSVTYDYIFGNLFINIITSNSILNNYIVTQYIVATQQTITTKAINTSTIVYTSCGNDINGDLICCPQGWSYTDGKCCPPS